MTTRRQLSLPEDLCATAEQRFGSSFDNLESLLEFILKELTDTKADALDQSEQAMLEERLRNLGYI
jgi:hypothetical protein